MKILLFYTSHRQLQEIGVSARFISRFSGDLRSADVLLHCNNLEIPRQELESMLAGFPNPKKELIHTSKNTGYRMGAFEALADSYPRFLEQPYDWVIHLHPDVFLTDEKKVLDALESADREEADFLCFPLFEDTPHAFTMDFFAWKASRIPADSFDIYLENLKPDGTPPETLLYQMIDKRKIRTHVIKRLLGRGWMREMDLLGIWHPHNNSRAEFFLRTGIYVPLGPYRTVENFFRRQFRRVFPKTLVPK